MLLKNIETAKGLVNGARGVVTEFRKPSLANKSVFRKIPVVCFEVPNGETETRALIEERFSIGAGNQ